MAKDRYEIDFSDDPVFNSVTGLSNITFNPSNIRSGHMATEDQLLDLYNRTIDAGQNLARCCKELLVWEAYTQVVRLHTNTLQKNNGVTLPSFSAGGVVVSGFNLNKSVGFMRRGDDYTITFPLPWDDTLYCPVTPVAGYPDCNSYSSNGAWRYTEFLNRVSYRRIRDSSIVNPCTTIANDKRAYFLTYPTDPNGSNPIDPNNLYEINYQNKWNAFTKTIGTDGKISITDHRKAENFNIMRYYTQFTLNICSDGTSLRAAIEPVIAEWNATHSENQQLLYAP